MWIGYRLVNDPTFADFLIAVEAEMNKVSWPSQTELIRASLVVIILIFGLTMVLFSYDVILSWILDLRPQGDRRLGSELQAGVRL